MIYDFKVESIGENSAYRYVYDNITKNQKVLDVGCATGYFGEYLKNNLDVDIVGVDYQEYHLEKAEKRKVYS